MPRVDRSVATADSTQPAAAASPTWSSSIARDMTVAVGSALP